MLLDEEKDLKESMSSLQSENKTNLDMDLILSQTTSGGNLHDLRKKDSDLTSRTKKLLDDYEKLKFESNHIKQEN